MKKLGLILALGVAVSGCATNGASSSSSNNLGMQLVQTAIKHKCQSEVVAHPYYKTASAFLSESARTKAVNSVCGCVGEKVPNVLTTQELTTAVISADARPAIVKKAVVGSLQACASDYIKTLY